MSTPGTPGAAGGAAAAAYVIKALKASGVIIHVEPAEFARVLGRTAAPLVVAARGGLLKRKHLYMTSYRGMAFLTKASDELPLPEDVELVRAKSIWAP